jgi:hypothetical protein
MNVKFATDTILEVEADIRTALRLVQLAGMSPLGEMKVTLLGRVVGLMNKTAETLSSVLSEKGATPCVR